MSEHTFKTPEEKPTDIGEKWLRGLYGDKEYDKMIAANPNLETLSETDQSSNSLQVERMDNESPEQYKKRLDIISKTKEYKDCESLIEKQEPSCYGDIALLMLNYHSLQANTEIEELKKEVERATLQEENLKALLEMATSKFKKEVDENDKLREALKDIEHVSYRFKNTALFMDHINTIASNGLKQ